MQLQAGGFLDLEPPVEAVGDLEEEIARTEGLVRFYEQAVAQAEPAAPSTGPGPGPPHPSRLVEAVRGLSLALGSLGERIHPAGLPADFSLGQVFARMQALSARLTETLQQHRGAVEAPLPADRLGAEFEAVPASQLLARRADPGVERLYTTAFGAACDRLDGTLGGRLDRDALLAGHHWVEASRARFLAGEHAQLAALRLEQMAVFQCVHLVLQRFTGELGSVCGGLDACLEGLSRAAGFALARPPRDPRGRDAGPPPGAALEALGGLGLDGLLAESLGLLAGVRETGSILPRDLARGAERARHQMAEATTALAEAGALLPMTPGEDEIKQLYRLS